MPWRTRGLAYRWGDSLADDVVVALHTVCILDVVHVFLEKESLPLEVLAYDTVTRMVS